MSLIKDADSDLWFALPHSSTATDLPGFTLLNARAGLGLGKAWRIDAFLYNITNQQAATAISPTLGPEHNRAWYVTHTVNCRA
jgi:outer membrane receptor protein involved in Fe transport